MPKKRIILALAALVGLIVVLILVQGGFHRKIPGGTSAVTEDKSKPRSTVKVETRQTSADVTVSGTVLSRETARVAPRVTGSVVQLNVDAGDAVTKGQTLVRIDSKEMADREVQARAALESATAELVKARHDFERFKALWEKQSIAKKDFDDTVARLDVAQSAEQRAQALLDEARTQRSYAEVTAPFDGVVASREVNLGDLATPGRPLLSIYDPTKLELVAAVGEQYVSFVAAGTPVTVAFPSVRFEQASTIREVVPQRDERTRTITVKVPLSSFSGLGPGLYGTLTFPTKTSEVTVIPARAITEVGQLETVKVLEHGTVKLRHVKTGRRLVDGGVEILSGLNAGEDVVVE